MPESDAAALQTGQQVTVVASIADSHDNPEILAFLAERIGQTGVVEDVASPDEHEYWILVRFDTPDSDGDYRLSFAARRARARLASAGHQTLRPLPAAVIQGGA